MEQNYARLIRDGALSSARSLGTAATILTGATSDDPWSKIQTAVTEYLQKDHRIDGVVCSSANSAMASATALEVVGRVLGKDIDIVAKETFPVLKQFRAPIMTQYEDVERAGAFLARAAIQRIADPNAPPMQSIEGPKARS